MKTAWQALTGPWHDWYAGSHCLEAYFSDRAGLRAEVRRLLHALAAHHRPTATHSLRVRRYALLLADELGIDRERQNQLSLAARLHDVGKLHVPPELLTRREALSPEETAAVREHVVLGERTVQAVTPCPAVHEAVRWHHERHDGAGYPDGLRGEQIPLFARILAVAEAYDAMTMYRQHAPALDRATARERLQLDAGRQFHPDIVAAFLAALHRNPARQARRYRLPALAEG